MTTPHDNDPVLAPFSTLRSRDLEPAAAERTRRAAQSVLRRERALADRPWLLRLDRIYASALEPAFVMMVSIGYVTWVVQVVIDLHR